MKITSESSIQTTKNTFEIEYEGEKLVYIEYLNDAGKVIDFTLEDENGDELTEDDGPDNNVAGTIENIQEFLDAQGK